MNLFSMAVGYGRSSMRIQCGTAKKVPSSNIYEAQYKIKRGEEALLQEVSV